MTSVIEEALIIVIRRAVHDELVAMGFRAMEPEPDLESLKGAAARFGVSVSWLKARHSAGELAFHGSGRMCRVRPAEVRALMATRKRAGPPSPLARAEEALAKVRSRRSEE